MGLYFSTTTSFFYPIDDIIVQAMCNGFWMENVSSGLA